MEKKLNLEIEGMDNGYTLRLNNVKHDGNELESKRVATDNDMEVQLGDMIWGEIGYFLTQDCLSSVTLDIEVTTSDED